MERRPRMVIPMLCLLLVLSATALPASRAAYGVELSCGQPFPDDIQPTPQLRVTREGTPVDFFMRLTNRGEQEDTYDVACEGKPPGWGASVNQSVVSLPPHQSQPIKLTVAPPASLDGGLQSWALLSVYAHSRLDPTCTTHLHTLTLLDTADRPAVVRFAGPGQSTRYSFTVTNTGTAGDAETLDAAYVHHEPKEEVHQPWDTHYPPSWTYALSASSFSLPAGGVASPSLSVSAPQDAVEGDYLILNLTARSGGDPSRTSRLTAITIVGQRYGVLLECGSPVKKVPGGETARFSINVTNTGTMKDVVSLRMADPPPGWGATLGAFSVILEAGQTRAVELAVTPPSDAPPDSTASVRVTGTSGGNGTKSSWVDTLTVANPAYLLRFNTTDMVHYVDPGCATAFRAEVRNLGYLEDAAIFDVLGEPGRWGAGLEPARLWVAPGASGPVWLNVTAPPDALAGETLDLWIRFRSAGDSTSTGTVLARTVVNLTRDLAAGLAPPSQQVPPEQGALFTLTVRNGGNADEPVTIERGRLPPGWTMAFNESRILVRARSSWAVLCTVTPDYLSPAGNYSFSAVVRSDWKAMEPSGTVTVESAFRFILECPGSELEAPPGGRAGFNLTVINRGNAGDTVGLELFPSGPGSNFSWSLDGGEVALPLGGSAQARLFLDLAIGALGGERQECRVRGTSRGAPSYWREVTLGGTAGRIHRLNATGEPEARQVEPGTSAFFSVLVQNGGNVPEEVRLDSGAAPPGWTITCRDSSGSPAAKFGIYPAGVIGINLSATPPPGAPAGDYRLTVNLTTASGLEQALRFRVRVLQVFDFEILPESSSLLVPAGKNATLRVLVRNLGNGPDTILLNLTGKEGEDWARPEPAEVHTGPNSTAEVTLRFGPPSHLRSGLHRFEIAGLSSGGAERNAILEIRVAERPGDTTTEPPCFALPLILAAAGLALGLLAIRSRRLAREG